MDSAFETLEDEIARYARLGAQSFEGDLRRRAADLFAAAETAASPRRAFCRAPLGSLSGLPASLAARASANAVYLLCATLGAGFDAWQRRVSAMSGVDALLAQAIGTALLEYRLDACEEEVRAQLLPGEELAPRLSPGYGDLPLELSREILSRLDAPRRLGVALTQAGLLAPAKSVTAFVPVLRISGE